MEKTSENSYLVDNGQLTVDSYLNCQLSLVNCQLFYIEEIRNTFNKSGLMGLSFLMALAKGT